MPFTPTDLYEVWYPTGGGGGHRQLVYSCDDQAFAEDQRDNNWSTAEVWRRQITLGLVTYTFIS